MFDNRSLLVGCKAKLPNHVNIVIDTNNINVTNASIDSTGIIYSTPSICCVTTCVIGILFILLAPNLNTGIDC